MAVVLSWVIGLPVGLIGAVWRNSRTDYATRFVVTLFMAIPSFWVGLMIVLSLVLFLHVATAPDHRVPLGRPGPESPDNRGAALAWGSRWPR